MNKFLVRSIPIIAIFIFAIVSCKKKNTGPQNMTSNIAGIRYWEGTSSGSGGGTLGSTTTNVKDTFEITALSDTQITVKDQILTLKSTDTSNQSMEFAFYNGVYYTVIYYYFKDSIYYRQNSSMAASQSSVLQLHTVD